MPFDRLQPYNDLPLLPPAAELETKDVLKQAIAANRVLANLRGLGRADSQPGRAHQQHRAAGGAAVVGNREHRHHQ